MTLDDAAQVLGIGDKSVAQLCRDGRLPGSYQKWSKALKRKVWVVSGKSAHARKRQLLRRHRNEGEQ